METVPDSPERSSCPNTRKAILTPADLVAAHGAIATAITAQEITPQDGAALATVLEAHSRAFELLGQEKRVEALETEVRHLRSTLT
jgi:hypothetical protein